MEKPTDRLYELLPLIYRMRDAEQGYPLQALLRIISEQFNVVETDINQLYDNWFIETAADWLVPYIGELVGYRMVHEAGEPGEITTSQSRLRNKILIPRREVANTVAYRRRKGTLALLEQLANDVTGWPARAVEFFKLLGWMQHLNHLRLARGRSVDLRIGEALDYLDGPFDLLAHTVDVRRVNSHRTDGRYNIPSIGLFIWRLKAYSVTRTAAYCLEQVSPRAYTFSILGNDTPLYNKPQPEPEPSHIAEPLNLPINIRRRPFEDVELVTDEAGNKYTQASADYYGASKSLLIWAPDWPRKGAEQPVPRSQIIPADLSDWQYLAPRNHIAVDPERGRIIFPSRQLPRSGVWVTYQYGFSADMGGGEYDRPLIQPPDYKLYRVCPDEEDCYPSIGAALRSWAEDDPKPLSAVVEIDHNGIYTETLRISLAQNEYLQIRAANGKRPVIRLLDYMAEGPDSFMIMGEAGSRFVLDGLLVFGRGLHILGPERDYLEATSVTEDLCQITIRHCTLVPGWSLDNDCEPQRPSEPSLELIDTLSRVSIEYSIIGSIQVTADAVHTDPIQILVSDSIIDATSADCDEPYCEALGAPGWPLAHAVLTTRRSTIFGRIHTHAIELAENSIFMGCITVGRSQQGCMRFCYVPPGSRTPRRYHCQPDLAEEAIASGLRQAAQDNGEPEPDEATIHAAQELEQERVRPQFNSTRYGIPTYCQLANACAEEIKRGADDESEMGVFHHLYQPQRVANLRARLDEYTPSGMNAGLILVK
jgi:hypothetical protein